MKLCLGDLAQFSLIRAWHTLSFGPSLLYVVGRELEILGHCDRARRTDLGALAAEEASSEPYTRFFRLFIYGDRSVGAGFDAKPALNALFLIDGRAPAKSLGGLDPHVGVLHRGWPAKEVSEHLREYSGHLGHHQHEH